MRALLSTIGSRGDVQPLVALGVQLRDLGVEVRLCVPPDFRAWIEGLGLPVVPIGPEVRGTATARPAPTPLTPEQRKAAIEGTVATQFRTIAEAARGCDLIVGATALQVAAPSVAERAGIPYVFVAYCPAVLPSAHHAPPVLSAAGDTPAPAADDYTGLWVEDARRWNELWRAPLNAYRVDLGLAEVPDVRDHVLTRRPWLAADPALAPWPDPDDPDVVQTGAWLLPDHRELTSGLERFLDVGEPPIYFGFGSNRPPEGVAAPMIEAARAAGRRVLVSRGWAGLTPGAAGSDCLEIGDTNLDALFPRVACVVHHGGAGTTTAAARAGTPQVVLPQRYDQHYWARRVESLGIGAAHPAGDPTAETLGTALGRALRPDVAVRAAALAPSIRIDAARTAAARLVDDYPAYSEVPGDSS